ncbi:MAG: NAD(P)/FAD-dependent oxidoreductase, partial [Clostridia bacterium]|nr:NAD(P)/FAD-dependent oxidoreductase [Clostridia bacterium]
GPLILSASSFINRCDLNKLKMFIDFKPALTIDALQNRIDRDIASLKAKQISSLLEGFLPKSLVKVFAKRLDLNVADKANQLSKEKRQALIKMLKNFELDVLELDGFNSAVVTAGGVSLKEIVPKYMKSKIIQNLYFIGEVLDIDALTGGFNLQLAFSTAVTAASDFKDINY